MEENPYLEFSRMFRNPDPSDGMQLCEGTVRSVSPLSVSAFNLVFSGPDVKVNAQLLAGWQQTVSIQTLPAPISGTQTVTQGVLQPGDKVLCLTAGGQTLYILMKVVRT